MEKKHRFIFEYAGGKIECYNTQAEIGDGVGDIADNTGSNNTSTINNNYYTQPETQTSNNQPEVQTIVVPVGNAGNDEPLQQTISIQGSPEGNSSEGMTLNVNVNIGSEGTADQEKSIIEQSGVSWYQVAVLCLLSLILGCVIKRP